MLLLPQPKIYRPFLSLSHLVLLHHLLALFLLGQSVSQSLGFLVGGLVDW
jgi:hypothetical protein